MSEGSTFVLRERDPDGDSYEDGSFDTLIEASWPSLYPTDERKVDLHFGACEVPVDARQLRWLQQHIPTLLGWLDGR